MRPDASPTLAAARTRLDAAGDWQARYVEGLRRRRGLSRVKLERTSTQGLFLEVPANTEVPEDWVRRGGLQRVERYTTPELEEHAVELAAAEALVAAETRAVLEARAQRRPSPARPATWPATWPRPTPCSPSPWWR